MHCHNPTLNRSINQRSLSVAHALPAGGVPYRFFLNIPNVSSFDSGSYLLKPGGSFHAICFPGGNVAQQNAFSTSPVLRSRSFFAATALKILDVSSLGVAANVSE